jgi:hypothetical protein
MASQIGGRNLVMQPSTCTRTVCIFDKYLDFFPKEREPFVHVQYNLWTRLLLVDSLKITNLGLLCNQ